tara:strand:- start:1237 stop:1371 length:135 start_codon:yes stop_codon:yes gene_type:complete
MAMSTNQTWSSTQCPAMSHTRVTQVSIARTVTATIKFSGSDTKT